MLIGFELASRPAKRNCKLGVCHRSAKQLIYRIESEWVPNGRGEQPRRKAVVRERFRAYGPCPRCTATHEKRPNSWAFQGRSAAGETVRIRHVGGARGIRTLGTTDTATCYTWIPRQLRAHLLPLNAASASSRSSENNTSKMPSDRLSCETVSWWCFKCLETPCDGRYRGTAPPGTAQGDRRGSPAGRCAPRTRARRR
jgi:hypothetical protein